VRRLSDKNGMNGPDTPRVSILIPNYNNGRASSNDGKTNLILDLLSSLDETLRDEPTPFEIIAYDDGSTDDSLNTLRHWSRRRWRGGQPFLELIEAEHCGVLARAANVLSRRARGRILVRLDGDTEMLTANWATKLCEVFDTGPPRLGIVGPKQLDPSGYIHAMGDWLIHPNGYHHIAHGFPRHTIRTALEVDHVMGCFYCMKRQVYEELGGYDEDYLRGQTVDFGLRARLAGFSCFAVPHIEFIHNQRLRIGRRTRADTRQGITEHIGTFETKWGFSRVAPDLDVVRRRYAGTPLLWNARWLLADGPADPPTAPIAIEDSRWADYDRQPAFRQAVDSQVAMVRNIVGQAAVSRCIVQINCGQGLFASLLAERSLPVVGTDRQPAHIALAQAASAQRTYPGPQPQFRLQDDRRRLPLEDRSAQMVLLINVLEKHANPVGLLAEAARVLEPGGLALITVARRRTADTHAGQALHPYRPGELHQQLGIGGRWALVTDPDADDGQSDNILIVAQRTAEEAADPARCAQAPQRVTA
jgi:GT2 family glycosyltransferase/SAM-dependent methyltransferase